MTRRSVLAIALIASLPALGARAQSAALQIYPVPGVYGLEQSACDRRPGQDPGRDTAKISPDLCPAFTVGQRLALGRHFSERVHAAFNNVTDDIAPQTNAGETAEARLSKTVIASLHLSRAELRTVEKPATIDVYAPVSASLYFTNALTGEVLFVENLSKDLGRQPMLKDGYRAKLLGTLPGDLNGLVDGLVAAAASKFKPFPVTGKIRGRTGDAYVIDVGRRGGVRDGDVMGADARVTFSDANYAVIAPLLGGLSVGQTLSRQVAQPIEMLAKPSALVVVADIPPSASRAYIASAFEDAIGSSAGFAIVPVNPSFAQLRQLAIGKAQLESVAADKRAIPDYFIRVSVATLTPVVRETNIANTLRRTYQAHAFIEVIDHSGRVVFATQAKNRIVDDVVDNIGFSADLRLDSAIKNALTLAAQSVATGFKPARFRLPAKPAGEEADIADPGGALAMGVTAAVLRRGDNISGIAGEIWSPVANVEVISVSAAGARARSADPIPVRVRGGDQVAFDGGGGEIQSRRRFAQCLSPAGQPLVSQRGAVAQPLFQMIAVNSFAAAFAGPVQLNGFAGELRPLLSQFAGADRLGALQARAADVCFEPIYQVDPIGVQGGGRGFVATRYALAAGYALRAGETKLGATGLQQELKATGVAPGADETLRDSSLQLDLADANAALSLQAAHSLKPPS